MRAASLESGGILVYASYRARMKIARNKVSERCTWQKAASGNTVLLTDDVK